MIEGKQHTCSTRHADGLAERLAFLLGPCLFSPLAAGGLLLSSSIEAISPSPIISGLSALARDRARWRRPLRPEAGQPRVRERNQPADRIQLRQHTPRHSVGSR